MSDILADGKPIYCEIDTASKRMWWVMLDFTTIRLFVNSKDGWQEVPKEKWKMADIERASILPDIAKEETEPKKDKK